VAREELEQGLDRDTKLFEESVFGSNVISVYTSDEAVEDGILARVEDIDPRWKGPVNIITMNLLHQGYMEEDGTVRKVNVMDLLNQATHLWYDRKEDWMHVFRIEFPDGQKREVWMEQNETGKFTLMLPEDH
jgi:hypothetical protein